MADSNFLLRDQMRLLEQFPPAAAALSQISIATATLPDAAIPESKGMRPSLPLKTISRGRERRPLDSPKTERLHRQSSPPRSADVSTSGMQDATPARLYHASAPTPVTPGVAENTAELLEMPPISESDWEQLRNGQSIPAELHERMLRQRTAQLTLLFQQKLRQQAVALRSMEEERERRHRDALDELNRAWEERYDTAVRRVAALRDAARRANAAESKLAQLAGELERTADSLAEARGENADLQQRVTQLENPAHIAAAMQLADTQGQLELARSRINDLERQVAATELIGQGARDRKSQQQDRSSPTKQSSRRSSVRGLLGDEEQIETADAWQQTVGVAVEEKKIQVGSSKVNDTVGSLAQRVRQAASLAVKIEEALEVDATCNACLCIFEQAAILIPCGHTLCLKCTDPKNSGYVICTQCGDREPRQICPNRVADSLSARYAVRASYVSQVRSVLQQLEAADV